MNNVVNNVVDNTDVRPSIDIIWASGYDALTTNPLPQSVERGWVQTEYVTPELFNWWMNRVDTLLSQLEQNSILGWVSSVHYKQGARTRGSNGTLYQALTDSLDKDPLTNPTFWRPIHTLTA